MNIIDDIKDLMLGEEHHSHKCNLAKNRKKYKKYLERQNRTDVLSIGVDGETVHLYDCHVREHNEKIDALIWKIQDHIGYFDTKWIIR